MKRYITIILIVFVALTCYGQQQRITSFQPTTIPTDSFSVLPQFNKNIHKSGYVAKEVLTKQYYLSNGEVWISLNDWNLPTQSILEGTEAIGVRNDGFGGAAIPLTVVDDNKIRMFCAEDYIFSLQPNADVNIEGSTANYTVNVGDCIWLQFDSKDSTYYIIASNYIDSITASNGLTRDGKEIILGGSLTDSTTINIDTSLLTVRDTNFTRASETIITYGLNTDVDNRYKNTSWTTHRAATIDSFNRSATTFINENEAYLGVDSLQNRHANIRATHNGLRPVIQLEARTSTNKNSFLTMTGDALALMVNDNTGWKNSTLRRLSSSPSDGIGYTAAHNVGDLNINGTTWTKEVPAVISTNTTVAYNLPASYDGLEGDVILFMNKSTATDKTITGDIDDTSDTITVSVGESVQFIWDEINTTWWKL